MGFLSNLFGTNQKRSVSGLGRQYDDAYKPATEAYSDLMGRGREMMDPNSAFNQTQKARMMAQGQDAAAESARMAQRTAAMSGGVPAAAMAAQARASSNKAQEASLNAYNEYLSGAMSEGTGLLSGAANNLATMNTNKMNAMNAQSQANAQLDSQAAGATASLIGTGLGIAGTALGGPVGGAIGSMIGGLFGQEGGGVSEKGIGLMDMAMMPDEEALDSVQNYQHGGNVDARENIAGLLGSLKKDKKSGDEESGNKEMQMQMAMKLLPMVVGAPPMSKGGEVIPKSDPRHPIHRRTQADRDNTGMISSLLKDSMDSRGKNVTSNVIVSEGFEGDEHYRPDRHTSYLIDEARGNRGKSMLYTKGLDGQLTKHPTVYSGGLLSGVRNLASQAMGSREVDSLPAGYSPEEMQMEFNKDISNLQKGDYVYGQQGGMLSQVNGPDGPMQIGTRMGGIQIG